MAAVLILALLASPPAGADVADSEWGAFVGFSRDDRLAAWRHDVHHPRPDGAIDQYSVIETIDTRSGYPVATFRATAIHRLDPNGRPIKVGKAKLMADNPAFAAAYPSRRWQKLEKRSGFSSRPVVASPNVLLVAPDEDVDGNGQAEQHKITMTAKPGSALGFTAIALDVNKERNVVGRFRQEGAEARSISAELRAFTSRSGRVMAVFTLFLVRDGSKTRGAVAIEVHRLEAPLASPKPFERSAADQPKVASTSQDEVTEPAVVDQPARPTLRLITSEPTTVTNSAGAAVPPNKPVNPWKMRASMSSGGNTLAAYKKASGVDTSLVDKREMAKVQGVYNWFVGNKPKSSKRR